MRAIIAAAILAASSMPTFALTLEDYPEYRVVWSLDCKNPAADRVDVKLDNITIFVKGTPHVYRGVELSKTFSGGARADGKLAWIFGSKEKDGDYVFIAEVPGYGRKGPLELTPAGYTPVPDLEPLWGKKFKKCPAE
ncbi:hypothetical protein [Microvirga guangxiensis]|uniref:Uncharacterized protein n=1 Tax=Microvirga guangxiensis TaxID=549386 RepID=A0A1G5KHG2_9HYPH|nr:hypothetical protein [Microvirga guangxiensis]SCZ00006.1 hypothetical protein SAMN02927923_03318 [Microvirga guangxiensis]